MSKRLAGILRTLFIILGLVLIALGVWPVLLHFDVGPIVELTRWVDHGIWAALPTHAWWPWALGAAAVLCTILAFWIIVATFKVHRINKVSSEASNDDGSIALQMNPIIGGIASFMENPEGVEKVERRVAWDRGHQQATFVIQAKPETPFADLVALAEQTERDFRAAFPDSDLETVYKLHYSRITA